MESNQAVIGALIFIALILGANLVMYAIARSSTRGQDSNWMSALKQGLSKPLDNESNRSMDELRKTMEELQKKDTKE